MRKIKATHNDGGLIYLSWDKEVSEGIGDGAKKG